MHGANSMEELESAIIALKVLCLESSKHATSLPPRVVEDVRLFFETYHEKHDIISKRLLMILVMALADLLGGSSEQVGLVAAGATVPILVSLVRNHHNKRLREKEPREITIWSLKCLQRIALHPELCLASFGGRLPDLVELIRSVMVKAPVSDTYRLKNKSAIYNLIYFYSIRHIKAIAKAEVCDFLTNIVVSCPLLLPCVIGGNSPVLQLLISSADIDEGLELKVIFSSLRTLSKMICHSSGDMVACIVNQEVLKVFSEFLGRDEPNNGSLLIDVLQAIEQVCKLGLHGEFHGWDEIDDLAVSFHDAEVSSMAERIHLSFCPADQDDWLLDCENDVALQNLTSAKITIATSKRRKVGNDAPVLGTSNRR
jgi:hypothetical protein